MSTKRLFLAHSWRHVFARSWAAALLMVVAGAVISTYPESSKDDSLLSAYRAIHMSQAQVTAASANGLIGYWSFDEGTGTTAADGSGGGNIGALTYGPVWATAANCKVGGCLQLDGVNDYVKINNSASLQLTGDVTISAWIKPTGLGVKQSIVSKRYEYELGEITTTSPYTLNWSHKASGGALVSGALVTAIDSNQWQHVVLVRDAAARQYKGFKNGVPVATTAYSLDPGTSTYNVNIGRNPGSNQWFKGFVDEVRLYNRALTDAEAQQLYNESGADTEAPTAPTSLSATPVSASQINLSWNASTDNTGVTGYKVYRGGVEIATVTTTSYQNTGLTPATTYTYTVAAVDAANNVSAQSTSVSATTLAADTQAPSIPTNLIAFSVSTSQVDLTWNASTDNVRVSGYRVYRNGSQIATTPATTYSDTGLASSTAYTYTIAAYDAAGNVSAPSAAASATTQSPPPPDTEAPTSPANLTANPISPSRINLSWSAATDNQGVTGYRVYRNGSQINTSTSTTYADTGLASSTTYNYTVAAEDAAGNLSAQSSTVSATTFAAAPSVTFEVRLTGSSNDAEESAGGSVSLTSTDLELVNDGSNQTVGMRFANVMAPNGATITNAYIQFGADESSTLATSLSIFGEASDNAATFTTAASNVSSRPKTSDPVPWNPPNWVVVGEVGVNQRTPNIASVIGQIVNRSGWLHGNALAIVITGTGKQVAYAYDGNASLAPLLHIEYTGGALPPDATPPTTPTNSHAAAVSSTQVNLYWNASVDNVGVAGYKIYRNGALVATTANTNYIDTGLSPQTTYSYTLAAYDATGNESLQTSALNATTLATGQVFAVTFVGAGDIADGEVTEFDFATAEQIDQIVALDPNTVVYNLGDNAYNLGTLDEYMSYYEPTWGRHFARTFPSPGNHDHGTPGASGYLDYFCPSPNRCRFPGGTKQLYYSYNIGPWHIISLDSEQVRNPGTPQYIWLQQDLANNPRTCTLAYWHVPYFGSSEGRGNRPTMRPFWDLLFAARADVVVNGHDHHYERFDPQDPDGVYDPVRGIRQFIAGSGGYALYDFQSPTPNSVVRQKSHGVLKLTLRETSYSWEFIGIDGFRDTGSGTCNP